MIFRPFSMFFLKLCIIKFIKFQILSFRLFHLFCYFFLFLPKFLSYFCWIWLKLLLFSFTFSLKIRLLWLISLFFRTWRFIKNLNRFLLFTWCADNFSTSFALRCWRVFSFLFTWSWGFFFIRWFWTLWFNLLILRIRFI